MVKGDLCKVTPKQVEDSYDGYVKRLWWNEEAYLREDGFEENYEQFCLLRVLL